MRECLCRDFEIRVASVRGGRRIAEKPQGRNLERDGSGYWQYREARMLIKGVKPYENHVAIASSPIYAAVAPAHQNLFVALLSKVFADRP